MGSDLKEELNQINEKIQELDNKRFFLQKQVQLESYLNNLELVGKCFQVEDNYFKVISLIIDNPYRCIVLKLEKGNQISFSNRTKIKDYVGVKELNEITNFEIFGIKVSNLMIKDLVKFEEISSARFERELLKKFAEIPNMIKKLKQIQAAAARNEFELNKRNFN